MKISFFHTTLIDTHLITSMSTEVRAVTWKEIKDISSSDPSMQSLTMLLRAEMLVFWSGMSQDVRKIRPGCGSCHTIAPS